MSCPLDHLLNPAEFDPSAVEFVREWSFLNNPRIPAALTASVQHTAIAAAGGAAELERLRALGGRQERRKGEPRQSTGWGSRWG